MDGSSLTDSLDVRVKRVERSIGKGGKDKKRNYMPPLDNNNRTSQTICSFSLGSDCAMRIVSVASVCGCILLVKSNHTFCNNRMKANAPLLLLPSSKG